MPAVIKKQYIASFKGTLKKSLRIVLNMELHLEDVLYKTDRWINEKEWIDRDW